MSYPDGMPGMLQKSCCFPLFSGSPLGAIASRSNATYQTLSDRGIPPYGLESPIDRAHGARERKPAPKRSESPEIGEASPPR